MSHPMRGRMILNDLPDYDRPASWFDSLKRYVQETDVSHLDLSNMYLKIEEVSAILKLLSDSQLCELDLSGNNLKGCMKQLSKSLIQSKIKKLSVSSCQLSETDIMYLMKLLCVSSYHIENGNTLGRISLKICKDTRRQIMDLDISENTSDFFRDSRSFVSYVMKSHLTVLNLGSCSIFGFDEADHFIQELHNTSLTHLNLKSVFASRFVKQETLLSLFSNLKNLSITHLNLSGNSFFRCDLKNLGDSLRDSKLVYLDLSNNMLNDGNVDSLCQAVRGTKITTLNLASNNIKGNNNLGCILMHTQIASLDLCYNHIEKTKMFSFPYFLKGSSVVSLKLSHCRLSDEIGVELMKSLKFSKLTELDVSSNNLNSSSLVGFAQVVGCTNISNFNFSSNSRFFSRDLDQALVIFGERMVGSKLRHINISHIHYYKNKNELFGLTAFLKEIKNSSVSYLNLRAFGLNADGFETILPHLVNAQLTHLNLSKNDFVQEGIQSLAASLKFTAITHIDLADTYLEDDDAKSVAECLPETCIIDLDLSSNVIKCSGAAALALSLGNSNIVRLKLNYNDIGDDGLKALAEHAETSLITVLEVNGNLGNRFPLETVIWNNRRPVHQLKPVVSFFKHIAPETGDSFLRFENAVSTTNVDVFLEECLSFYKTVSEQSATVRVLAQEESISLSRDQISTLLVDEFPQQFAVFIATKIEAEVSEHVCLLKRAEELGLDTIVELLLLHRFMYLIEESQGILHPYTYELLMKYKLPICNPDIEPRGIEKIIKYFTTFADIEGAAGVVKMLQNIIVS